MHDSFVPGLGISNRTWRVQLSYNWYEGRQRLENATKSLTQQKISSLPVACGGKQRRKLALEQLKFKLLPLHWLALCALAIGWIMEVQLTNMKLSGANMQSPRDKYERGCEREISSQPAAGWWTAAVALLQQGRRNRESRRRKAAATAAEICLNRGRGLGWGLSGWCLFWIMF